MTKFFRWSLLLLLVAGGFSSYAAAVSVVATGNWSNPAIWSTGGLPANGDDITIGAGFTLTVDGNYTAASMTVGNGSTLSVNSGVLLTITNGLIFPNLSGANATGTVTGAGSINAATLAIGGQVTPGTTGTFTTTVTSTITSLTLSGAATLTSQRVTTPSTRVNNPAFQLQSGTVTVNGTLSCVTTNSNGSTTLVTLATGAQSGTLVLGNATPITTSNNNGVSTFTFTGTTATVNYSGAAQTVYNVNYTNLTLSGSGSKTLQTGTTNIGGNLTLSGTASTTTVVGLTMGAVTTGDGTTLTAAGFGFTVTGACAIGGGTSGTFNISSATGNKTFGSLSIGAGATWNNSSNDAISIGGDLSVGSGATFSEGTGRVTFTGATNNTISSVNTTLAFGGGITVNKGTSQANVLDVTGLITMSTGGLTITNGTFKLSSASTITAFSTDPNLASTTRLWVNSGTVSTSTRLTFRGTVQVSAGTLNVGTANDDYLYGNGGTLTMQGGAINVAGELSDSAPGNGNGMIFNMSAGTITVTTVAGGSQDYPFYVSSNFGSTFTMSGGSLIIQNPTSYTTDAGYYNHATTSFTNGTIQLGNSSTPASSTIGVDATTSISNLAVGGANATGEIQSQAITVSKDFTISSGAFDTNGFNMTVNGNWTNNGVFTNGSATVTFNGIGQSIGGTKSTTFYNLTLGGSGNKSLAIATFISNNLVLNSGCVINPLSITTHTAKHFSTNGTLQAGGSWGSTASAATNQSNTFFTAGTAGMINVTGIIYYTRQTGNWNSNTSWSTVGFGNATNNGTFPKAGDEVNIGDDVIITVTANAACGSIAYSTSPQDDNFINLNSGISLTVSGLINLPRSGGGGSNTLAVGAGILTASSLSFTNSGTNQRHFLTISTGTATITGDITTDGTSTSPTITFTGSGTLNVGGAFLNSSNSTFTASTGTVNYNGVAQVVGDFNYYNLTLSGSGTKDFTTNDVTTINNNLVLSGTASLINPPAINVGGSFTLGAGTTFTPSSNVPAIGGDWINNGGTFNNSGSTINFDGNSATQTIGGTTSTTFNNVTMTGNNTVVLGIVTSIGGNLSINTGTVLDLGTNITHGARTLTLGGTPRALGTWGSTASAATNQNNTYFLAGHNGILDVSNRIYFSRQNGNWNANTSWSTVTYGNATNAGTFPGIGDDVRIGGNMTITVTANGAAGTIAFQSNTGNDNNVTINSGITLQVAGSIDLARAGGGGSTTLAVGAGTLTAGSLIFTNTGGAQRHALTISTGTVTISGDVTADAVNTSPTITFTGAGTLNVAMAFLNSSNCTFTQGTGTVNYNGTSVAQTIGDFTYYNLTLNNTSSATPQLSLLASTSVRNMLTMTSGITNLAGFTLSLGNTATASTLTRTSSTTTNWLYGGTLRRYWVASTAITSTSGNYYGLFPMGTSTASTYRPLEVNSTINPSASGTYSVTHTGATGITDLSPTVTDGTATIQRIDNSQFVGATANGLNGGQYSVNITMTDLGGTGNITDIRLATYTGGTTAAVVGTHATATGTVINPTAKRTGLTVTQLSRDFRVSTANSAATPLPLELMSFTASPSDDGVQLHWVTSAELNNDFFTVQRSENGEKFEDILQVAGSGTSRELNKYQIVDRNPLAGRSYYRLIQTDFDGSFANLGVVSVTFESLRESKLSLYPNPAVNKQFNIELNGLSANKLVSVKITNAVGVVVFNGTYKTDGMGLLTAPMDMSEQPGGMYIVSITDPVGLHMRLILP